ncbi:Uncharacterised protein [Haemophilus haemolyticus]|uniref:Uncharacterized protein n=2 Tax=Haemophilus haemolyticus TaxID=726 RepID=A0A2X4RNE8_HAEHA|nr:Uncharacterised protein [Haemophilus haemolyticus]
MKIVKSSLNAIDVFGTRQETRAIVGAVTGTLGSAAVSNGLSKVNISPSINKMIVPTGSAIISEYLGDAEKLKQHYRFLEEKYAK